MGSAPSKDGADFRAALHAACREASHGDMRAVLETTALTHNTTVMKVCTQKRLDLQPGGHVRISNARGASKSYTPFLVEDDGFTVAVKRYDKGEVSGFMCERKIGDLIRVSDPMTPLFDVDTVLPGQSVVLVGGGTGVAPLYSIAEALLRKTSGIHVTLFACFRNEAEVLLEAEMKKLASLPSSNAGNATVGDDAGTYRLYVVLSRPSSSSPPSHHHASLPVRMVGRFCADHVRRAQVATADFAVICGPPGFGDTASNVVASTLGTAEENIYVM